MIDLSMSTSLHPGGTRGRGSRDGTMSDAKVITIMILFHLCGYKCLKHFYINEVCENMPDPFPNTVSYNRFVELERKVAVPFILFVKKSMEPCMSISFVGKCAETSTFTSAGYSGGFTQRGQCPMGWFYGFKLHLIYASVGFSWVGFI